jgi:hypothetical protein
MMPRCGDKFRQRQMRSEQTPRGPPGGRTETYEHFQQQQSAEPGAKPAGLQVGGHLPNNYDNPAMVYPGWAAGTADKTERSPSPLRPFKPHCQLHVKAHKARSPQDMPPAVPLGVSGLHVPQEHGLARLHV